jgi:hypothetical protein
MKPICLMLYTTSGKTRDWTFTSSAKFRYHTESD